MVATSLSRTGMLLPVMRREGNIKLVPREVAVKVGAMNAGESARMGDSVTFKKIVSVAIPAILMAWLQRLALKIHWNSRIL